jgi:uracil-DNA glycosylase family 4
MKFGEILQDEMSDYDSLIEQLKSRLEFYREIGIQEIFLRPIVADSKSSYAEREILSSPEKMVRENDVGTYMAEEGQSLSLFEKNLDEAATDDSLEKIRGDIGDCQRCKLCSTRTNIVFGSGNPKAHLVFVGEGPGAEEDAQGLPFVGRAGQLLTKIIESINLKREDVYICNVIKCRPPNNRFPEKDEIATCSPFLLRQLEVIHPKIICCLGAAAAQTILKTKSSVGWIRGRFQDYRGAKLIVTYHPAYLLRNPDAKKVVWEDMKRIKALLETT